MAPVSHDPYAPANRRPRRSGLDAGEAEHEAHSCLICDELAAAGFDVRDLPEHLPAQHIGSLDGDVILSVEIPPSALTYGEDQDPLRFTQEWWAAALPEGVTVLHVAERRIPLPRVVREGVWQALASLPDLGDDEDVALVDALVDAWQDAEDRQALEDIAESLTEADWLDFAAAWRTTFAAAADVGEDGGPVGAGLVQATIDALNETADTEESDTEQAIVSIWFSHVDEADRETAAAELAAVGEWLASCEDRADAYAAMDTLLGGEGPHKVAEYDRAIFGGATHEEAMEAVWGEAEGTDPNAIRVAAEVAEALADGVAEFGPVPDGHVRVGFSRDDVDTGPNGEPMGYGMTGDVPTDAKAAIGFIATGVPADDAARLVLAAELTRAPAQRRKSVLDAVASHLSPAEMEERTRRVDAPDQIVEGPAEGDSSGG